jgi:hypothetical protein
VVICHRNEDGVSFAGNGEIAGRLRGSQALTNALLGFNRSVASKPAHLPANSRKRRSLTDGEVMDSKLSAHSMADVEDRPPQDSPSKPKLPRLSDLGRASVLQGPTSWEAFHAQTVKFRAFAHVFVMNDLKASVAQADRFVCLVKANGSWRCDCKTFGLTSDCFHRRSAIVLDDLAPLSPQTVPVLTLRQNELWLAEDSGYKRAVVACTNAAARTFVCSSDWCSSINAGVHRCPHVKLVVGDPLPAPDIKQVEDDPELDESEAEQEGKQEDKKAEQEGKQALPLEPLRLISQRRVVFPLDEPTKALIAAGQHDPAALPVGANGIICLRPRVAPGERCKCGELYVDDEHHLFRYGTPTTLATVYFRDCARRAEMYGLRCPAGNKECTKHYEGDEHCLRACTAETVISELVFTKCHQMVRPV